MKTTDLSDGALRFWAAFFLSPGNTLRFGGEGARMAITPAGRTALDELLALGAVEPAAPADSIPGREHYVAAALDLRDEIRERAGAIDLLSWSADTTFVMFVRVGISAESLITAERQRQVEAEGFDTAHDDDYDREILLDAARGYVDHGADSLAPSTTPPAGWPWPEHWWKPRGLRDDLVRAGALCLAEKGRCERASLPADRAQALYERVVGLLDEALCTPEVA